MFDKASGKFDKGLTPEERRLEEAWRQAKRTNDWTSVKDLITAEPHLAVNTAAIKEVNKRELPAHELLRHVTPFGPAPLDLQELLVRMVQVSPEIRASTQHGLLVGMMGAGFSSEAFKQCKLVVRSTLLCFCQSG